MINLLKLSLVGWLCSVIFEFKVWGWMFIFNSQKIKKEKKTLTILNMQ